MTDNYSEDRRRFHRILFDADAAVTCDDQRFDCKIIDLSLKGAHIQLSDPRQISLGSTCELTINLSEQTNIGMQATISHINGEKLGLQCRNIDIDSISNLRRLMELNLGNSDLLEREFAALGHFDL